MIEDALFQNLVEVFTHGGHGGGRDGEGRGLGGHHQRDQPGEGVV